MRLMMIIYLISLLLFIASCSSEQNSTANNLAAPTKPMIEQQKPIAEKNAPQQGHVEQDGKPSASKRKYKFPSIMVKDDLHREDNITADRRTSLLANLVVNGWSIIRDKHGRLCKFVSPEITYAELQEHLHFNDSDVTYHENPKPGEPQAVIQTEWLTCNITFSKKVYDGKDRSEKLKSVLIDNKVQANADKEAEYDKNKGIIRRVIDYFVVVHQ